MALGRYPALTMARWLFPIHPKTFPQPGYCAAHTIPWRLQLLPKRRGGFEQVRRSPFQSRPETTARLLPRHEVNVSAVDLVNTLRDLLPPGFFCAGIDSLIQTADQRRANLRR